MAAVSNFPDSLPRSPHFEELRARAERAVVDALGLWTELQATLAEVRHRWGQIRTRASQERQGEQAADPALPPCAPCESSSRSGRAQGQVAVDLSQQLAPQ
jgi:hypothetical protein